MNKGTQRKKFKIPAHKDNSGKIAVVSHDHVMGQKALGSGSVAGNKLKRDCFYLGSRVKNRRPGF